MSSELEKTRTASQPQILTPKQVLEKLKHASERIAKEYQNLTIIGDIVGVKFFKGDTGASFKLVHNKETVSCKVWSRGLNMSLRSLEELENKTCHVTGGVRVDSYFGLHYIVQVSSVQLLSEDSHLKRLKQKCTARGFFENKKSLPPWHNIRHLGIISKQDTQGYNDFLKQFCIPIEVSLVEITLEGPKTASECASAVKKLQGTDLILIVRGGGSTTSISKAFDELALFEAIRQSSVPVATAIGHEADKDDKLLITGVSDRDFPTPSTAAVELSALFLTPIKTRVDTMLKSIKADFDTEWNKKYAARQDRLQNSFEMYRREQFGGVIIPVDEETDFIIVEKMNRLYKIVLDACATPLDVSAELVEKLKRIDSAIEDEELHSALDLLKTLPESPSVQKMQKLVGELIKLDGLSTSFESIEPVSHSKMLYTKYESSKLSLKARVKWYEQYLWYYTQLLKNMVLPDMLDHFAVETY